MPFPIFTVLATAAVLLAAGLPSQAQFAFNSAAGSASSTASPEPDAPAKASAYKTVHGVVQVQQGALPGATVWLNGTRTIVATNAEGEFELRVPAETAFIELTCGYAGLQDEVVRLPPAQALASVYLIYPQLIK
jgi:hypothetical protein